MNRTLKESLTGGRNVTVGGSLHRRGPGHKDSDDKLDLFAKNRRTLSVASSDESDISVKLGRLSVGSVKMNRNGVDDLLTSSSTDGGKHDYDWLLTPPQTPLTSSEGSETRPSLTASRRGSLNRSASTAKTSSSRLSSVVSHSESNNSSSRPMRSSSVTRSSVSYNTQYNNSSTSYTNKSTSILNTSSSSVSSYSRPSTPTRSSSSIARPSTPSSRSISSRSSSSIARPSTPSSRSISSRSSSSIARPSTPSSRSISSRSSTPTRTRPGLSNSSSSIDRTKPSQISRPQIPAITNSLTTPSVSRPSTPTRRNPPPSIPNLSPASTSNARFPSSSSSSSSRPSSPNKQTRPTAPSSRPSSPSSRPRPTAPLILHDFHDDTPPNLRTSLPPDRPLSAGRSRPGSVVSSKANHVEASTPSNLTRRQSSSPNRRLSEPNNMRGRLHGNGQGIDAFESHSSSRKPIKSSSSTTSMENNGFGRNISKKSMDMAMRHMDIRLSGSSLFPQSIRSGNNNNKGGQAIHVSNGNLSSLYENGHILEKEGDYASYRHENGNGNNERLSVRASEPEFYESSRYDAILLKEDLKNTNWLHSIDDDQGSIFDHGFEPLPEPFDPLYNK